MDDLGPLIEFAKSGGAFGAGLAVGLGLYFLERGERTEDRKRYEAANLESTKAMNDTADALRELNRLLFTPAPRRR